MREEKKLVERRVTEMHLSASERASPASRKIVSYSEKATIIKRILNG
jgi:hypothetical protein